MAVAATAAPAVAATATHSATATAAPSTAAVDRIKLVFRQALIAIRYAVAAAVTVVVVMTAVYAFHVVARTDDLDIQVVNNYISVDAQNKADPKLSFTLSADNPSGRVRFYYTGIQCKLEVNDSTDPSMFSFPDMVVAADSVLKIDTEASFNSTIRELIYADLFLANGTLTGNLTLSGNLTVGVYSAAHNKTSVRTYYCRSLKVGDVSGSSSDMWSGSCLTIEEMLPMQQTHGRQ